MTLDTRYTGKELSLAGP